MGFEQTISDYRSAQSEFPLASPEEKEFMQAMALQKAFADRMVEKDASLRGADEQELASVTLTEVFGEWFRTQVMEFQSEPETKSRRQYFLELFDRNPQQAVEELYQLYRSELH